MIDIYNELTPQEKLYFDMYKRGEAYTFNSRLLGTDGFQNVLDTIDKMILRDCCEQNITLYRATYDGILLPYINEENNTLSYPAYLSTCPDVESIQRHFSGTPIGVHTVMIINCPAETNMVLLEADHFSQENEILLGRDRIFNIVRNELTTDLAVIEQYMGRFYAQGVTQLRVLEVDLIG